MDQSFSRSWKLAISDIQGRCLYVSTTAYLLDRAQGIRDHHAQFHLRSHARDGISHHHLLLLCTIYKIVEIFAFKTNMEYNRFLRARTNIYAKYLNIWKFVIINYNEIITVNVIFLVFFRIM